MQLLVGASLPQLPFVIVNTESGEILRTGTAPAELVDLQAQNGEAVFVGYANDTLQYIDILTAAVMSKPQMSPVVDASTISGLPSNCIVIVEGQQVSVTGSEITLEFDVPGTYSVLLRAPCYLDAIVEVVQS